MLAFSDKKETNELERYPFRVVIGGVEIACGALISVLAFPYCTRFGMAIITHGVSRIYSGYIDELEEGHKNKNEKSLN